MTAECTNDDKWNCKYCRKVETCQANKTGSTASPPTTAKWCKPCRETGAIHCSDPANCGGPWDAREARPSTPTGWSDTDWLKHLQEQQHPLAGLHINQGSMDAAADAYEAEYNARHNLNSPTDDVG